MQNAHVIWMKLKKMSALQVLCIILLLINVAELLGLIIRQQMASTPVIPPVYLFVPGVQGFLMVSKKMFALHSTTLVLFQSHLFAFMFNDIVSNFELYDLWDNTLALQQKKIR